MTEPMNPSRMPWSSCQKVLQVMINLTSRLIFYYFFYENILSNLQTLPKIHLNGNWLSKQQSKKVVYEKVSTGDSTGFGRCVTEPRFFLRCPREFHDRATASEASCSSRGTDEAGFHGASPDQSLHSRPSTAPTRSIRCFGQAAEFQHREFASKFLRQLHTPPCGNCTHQPVFCSALVDSNKSVSTEPPHRPSTLWDFASLRARCCGTWRATLNSSGHCSRLASSQVDALERLLAQSGWGANRQPCV